MRICDVDRELLGYKPEMKKPEDDAIPNLSRIEASGISDEDIIRLALSDFEHRVRTAMCWGRTEFEALELVRAAFTQWGLTKKLTGGMA